MGIRIGFKVHKAHSSFGYQQSQDLLAKVHKVSPRGNAYPSPPPTHTPPDNNCFPFFLWSPFWDLQEDRFFTAERVKSVACSCMFVSLQFIVRSMGLLSKEWGRGWPFWRVLERLMVLSLATPRVVVVSLLSIPSSWVHVLNVTACLRVAIAVMKHYDQKHLGRKGFIVLMIPHHCSSSKKIRTGTQAWQEPGGRSLMQRPWRGAAY